VNPFRIEGPAVVSFSGGRTSAYMLRRILDAHDGKLPSDVHVMFANTGKERPETLDFVRDCQVNWDVDVEWLEYRRTNLPVYRSADRAAAATRARAVSGRVASEAGEERGFTIVDYGTAARNGEPFENLIDMMGIPPATHRMCTQEMKIRPIKKRMLEHGHKEWANIVGIRADEPMRVARMRAPTGQRWDNVVPLADAGCDEPEVMAFWKAQTFDLRLIQNEGNCDLCPLKAVRKRVDIVKRRPDLLPWWIAQEKRAGQTFRPNGDTFEKLQLRVLNELPTPSDDADDIGDCICHD
jgi:3'-phosphoadenosine 5'-phosphosulfate sulfotransferase (PAPS reductase)/FAD synthetase